MPTYDYGCTACGHRFEVFEPMSAFGPRECPRCGKRRARRLLGAGAAPVKRGTPPLRGG
jgi:putative FmdB family regulatory protein